MQRKEGGEGWWGWLLAPPASLPTDAATDVVAVATRIERGIQRGICSPSDARLTLTRAPLIQSTLAAAVCADVSLKAIAAGDVVCGCTVGGRRTSSLVPGNWRSTRAHCLLHQDGNLLLLLLSPVMGVDL